MLQVRSVTTSRDKRRIVRQDQTVPPVFVDSAARCRIPSPTAEPSAGTWHDKPGLIIEDPEGNTSGPAFRASPTSLELAVTHLLLHAQLRSARKRTTRIDEVLLGKRRHTRPTNPRLQSLRAFPVIARFGKELALAEAGISAIGHGFSIIQLERVKYGRARYRLVNGKEARPPVQTRYSQEGCMSGART